MNPWNRYPALTLERLTLLGRILRRERLETAQLHDAERGDSTWSLHCRAYSRSCWALRRATQIYPWLTVDQGDETLQFNFNVGGVPLRFYRGSRDEPAPTRYRQPNSTEFYHQQMLLGLGIRLEGALRILIETDLLGYPLAAVLNEIDSDGIVLYSYLIPEIGGEEGGLPPPPRSGGPTVFGGPSTSVALPPATIEEIETEDEDIRRASDER